MVEHDEPGLTVVVLGCCSSQVTTFIIEPFVPHKQEAELYLSIQVSGGARSAPMSVTLCLFLGML